MAETQHQKEAREALEKAKQEADKALANLKAGHLQDQTKLKDMKEKAAAFFDFNGSC